jgi:two-component system sensor histidine kinase BaeS
VTNAVRHTREGDRVRLVCRRAEEWTELEVADAGDGIRASDLPHLFDPWYRGGKRDDRVGGLGLMIVREVAIAHGGTVDVASREGQGTTFTMRIPATTPRPEPLPAALRPALGRLAAQGGSDSTRA